MRMDYRDYLEKIKFPEEAAKLFWQIHSSFADSEDEAKMKECYAAYDAGDEAFGAWMLPVAEREGVTPEMMTLYLYLRMTERTLENYRRLGIPDEHFYINMCSMSGCCMLCYERDGVYGLSQTTYRQWQRLMLDTELFNLGRLQFQLRSYDVDIEIDGHFAPAGTTVLAVHIPRYLPLTEEACDASYAWAKEFFGKYFGMKEFIFGCSSWLLHPWMQEVLPPDSAIIRFQKTFKILSVTQSVTSAVNWIFPGYADKDISEYPTKTSLQRAAIRQIRENKPIGTAFGVRL